MNSQVELVAPAPESAWAQISKNSQSCLVTQTPSWTKAIASTTRWQDATFLCRLGDREVIFPLVSQQSGQIRLASFPRGWGIGGPLSNTGHLISKEEAGLILSIFLGDKQPSIYLRTSPFERDAWEQVCPPTVRRIHRTTHICDLRPGWKRYWESQVSSETKREARRAIREGIALERRSDLVRLDDFLLLYCKSIERWGERETDGHPPSPNSRTIALLRRKIEAIAGQFGKALEIWVAHKGSRPAAGLVVLWHGNHIKLCFSAIDRKIAAKTKASSFLHSELLAAGCSEGMDKLYMGDTRGESLSFFKERLGGRPHTSTGYFLNTRDTRIPE